MSLMPVAALGHRYSVSVRACGCCRAENRFQDQHLK